MERILLLSDLMICDTEATDLKAGKMEKLFAPELCNLLFSNDQIIVANLEGPITETDEKQDKGDSPNIRSDPAVILLLQKIPHVIISGANNHITDYAEKGIRDTQNYLRNINVPTIGFAGKGDSLCTEHQVVINNQRICIYSVAQNEFSSMRFNPYGANGYDPLTTFDYIRDLKSNADHLVVLFHAGKENYRYPTPEQQRICRKMVDCGADLVVCQHSHCIGCQESYLDGKIIYGTGNFYFNLSADSLWDDSLIPVISFNKSGKLIITYKVLHRDKHYLKMLEGSEAEKVLDDFDVRSQQIMDQTFVYDQWVNYCRRNQYYLLMKGFSRVPLRFIYRIDSMMGHKLFHLLFRKKERNLTCLNVLRCEAINEMAQTVFSELSNK